MGAANLDRLLKVKTQKPLSLNITETDIIECKEKFNAPMKTIAAFANNRGGYFIYGVKDKTWEILGLKDNKFEEYDLKDLNKHIRSQLSIELKIQKTVKEVQGKKIGVLYVAPAHTKPVIFVKSGDGAAEGHIYYRYPGEDRLIASSDLQKIIEERVRGLSETILTKHINNILANGIDNSAVLNIQTGEVDGKGGNFLIDESILPKLSFVKEGEFVEKSGAPTLKLVGEVRSTGNVIKLEKGTILNSYPYSYRELLEQLKKKKSDVTPNKVNAIIKAEKVKSDTNYSAYNFRNKQHLDSYKKTGKVQNNTPSIYNDAAVALILTKLG